MFYGTVAKMSLRGKHLSFLVEMHHTTFFPDSHFKNAKSFSFLANGGDPLLMAAVCGTETAA